jgi:transposase
VGLAKGVELRNDPGRFRARLPDRCAASFEDWLREHPGVTVVSRDRDGVYAEGGYSGAPRALQVADRFHLVQSLTRAVQDELAHRRDALRMPTQEIVGHNLAKGGDRRTT